MKQKDYMVKGVNYMSERIEGSVKWFSNERGFGFLFSDEDAHMDEEARTNYFVHYTSIEMEGYKTLKSAQRVTFVLKDTPRGKQAFEVLSG